MSSASRRLVLHIGTAKTGTTSLQIAMGEQTDALARRGVLVPRSGRGATPHVGAHHALAASAAGMPADPSDALPALFAELEASSLPSAVVSSENFAWLYLYPERIADIVAGLRTIGYSATIVLYVRDQSAFAESVYAEFVQQGFAWRADTYVAAILDRTPSPDPRRAWAFCFDYLAIASRFAEAVGAANVVVRPYRADASADHLLRDFSSATGLSNDGSSLFATDAIRHNPRQTPLALFDRLYDNASAKRPDAPSARALIAEAGFDEAAFVDRPFAMLTSREVERIRSAFDASNRELASQYACEVELAKRSPIREAPPDRSVLDLAAIRWGLEGI